MIKFQHINQFRDLIKDVRSNAEYNGQPFPVLKFIGTVKTHGTNFSVVRNPDGNITFQTREREITIEYDNAGSCMFGERNIAFLAQTFDNVIEKYPEYADKPIVIFSEFIGKGIQKGVAVSQLEKMMIVFNITIIDGEEKIELVKEDIESLVCRNDVIYTVYDFRTYHIYIDFKNIELAQNQLVEWTVEVENECPVGKHFGISGIGEGIVISSEDFRYRCKIKGEKHQNSKVKTLKEIAACDIERMNSIDEFVDNVLTTNRMEQGLAKLGEMGLIIDVKNTGAYMKWVINDCLREEKDVIIASGFEVKEISPKLSAKAKKFWFEVLAIVE